MSYHPDDALYLRFGAGLNELVVKVQTFLSSRSMVKTGGQLFALHIDDEKIKRLREHEEKKVRDEMCRLGIDDWETRKIPLVDIPRVEHLLARPDDIARHHYQKRVAAEEAAKPQPKAEKVQTPRRPPPLKPPAMRPPAARKAA